MNKKLLIAAVGAALVAGSVTANAAATVYGKLNVGIANVDNGTDAVLGVTDDASRLGVKGDEDLGGGLKAIYQWEMTLDIDNGALGASSSNGGSTVGSRDAFLGLSGSWGSVRLGSYNSAYKNVSVPLEIFGDTVGDFTHTTMSGEGRFANTIGYTSPNFNGFTVAVERSHAEVADVDATDPLNEGATPLAIALTYSMGPLYVSLGQLNYDDAANVLNVGSGGSFTAAMGSGTKIAAKYTMGPFGIWFVQDTVTGEVTAAGTSLIPAGTEIKLQTQHIGASFALGANTTLAVTNTTYKDVGDIDEDIATQMSAGVIHNLSKSTAVKFVYTSLNNEDGVNNAGRILSSGGMNLGTGAAGDSVTGTQVQLSTTF